MKNNSFTIVGGGSAGWISALYLKKFFPDFEITVVESEEIGILGAGEGTVPNIINLLKTLGIDYKDVINATNGTIKLGVKFQNWNGDDEYYYHPFVTTSPLISEITQNGIHDNEFLSYGMIANDIIIGKNTTASTCCDINKIPFITVNGDFVNFGHFALHFDAKLFADFLKNTAIKRGVTRKEGIITDINLDSEGNISSINLKNSEIIQTDFVIDCSGFQKLIIGKKFGSEWISYSDVLPVNSAVGFFLEKENSIPPYTTALAMKYGWLWKIPLQNRTGCGYVFDDSYISTEDAIKEISNTLNLNYNEINIQRTFKFEAGCYKRTWINNCVSLGLSSCFVEPLEATSIMTVIKSLEIFKNLFISYDKSCSNTISEIYNKEILKINEQILNFISAHYFTQRNDTEFWSQEKFKNNNSVKKIQSQLINISNKDLFDIFGALSWMIILQGNKTLSKNHYEKFLNLQNLNEDWNFEYNKYSKNVRTAINDFISHDLFLTYIKS